MTSSNGWKIMDDTYVDGSWQDCDCIQHTYSGLYAGYSFCPLFTRPPGIFLPIQNGFHLSKWLVVYIKLCTYWQVLGIMIVN